MEILLLMRCNENVEVMNSVHHSKTLNLVDSTSGRADGYICWAMTRITDSTYRLYQLTGIYLLRLGCPSLMMCRFHPSQFSYVYSKVGNLSCNCTINDLDSVNFLRS